MSLKIPIIHHHLATMDVLANHLLEQISQMLYSSMQYYVFIFNLKSLYINGSNYLLQISVKKCTEFLQLAGALMEHFLEGIAYSQSLIMEHFLQEHVHFFMEPAKCKIYLCLDGDLPSMNQTIRNKIFKKGQLHIIFLYTELVPNQQKTPHLTNQFVKALDFYLRLLDVVFSTRPVEDQLTITKVVAAQF